MTEAFFFRRRSGLSLREIGALTGAAPQPGAELDRRVTGIAALDRAAPDDLCFLDSAKFAEQASICEAGACLTLERLAHCLPARVSLLLVRAPYRAFVQVSRVAVSGRAAPLLAVRGAGHRRRRAGAPDRPPGERRHDRSRAR